MKPAVLLTLLRGIERLAEGLLDRSDVELITLYDTPVPFLQDRGIPFRRFAEFETPEQRERSFAEAHWRSQHVINSFNSEEMRKSWPDYDDAPFDALRNELFDTLRTNFYNEVTLIDTLRRCASQTDLRAIVVHQDICRDTKTLVSAAKRLGIPSVHLTHGFPYGGINSITMRDPSLSEVIAVYSERLRDMYLGFGVARDRLVVTGNPEWDAFSRMPLPGHREQICAKLNLDPARPIIVYALTYIDRLSPPSLVHARYVDDTTEAVVRAFRELSERHPDWQFVLRPHPNDPDAPQYLTNLAGAVGLTEFRIDTVTNALSCVTMCDLMVCTHSNMGIEALIAGKPVVNCVLRQFCHDVFEEGVGPLFLEDDAVITASEPSEIAPAVERALLSPDIREWFLDSRPTTLRRFNYLNDGKALDRVCAAILQVVERNFELVAPIDRYPDFERLLAEMVPPTAKRIAVAGAGASWVALQIRERHPSATVQLLDTGKGAESEYDCVVLAEPLAHDNDRVSLGQFLPLLSPNGGLVFFTRHGGSPDTTDARTTGKWVPARPGFEAPIPVDEYRAGELDRMMASHGLTPEYITCVSTGACREASPCTRLRDDPTVAAWAIRARRT